MTDYVLRNKTELRDFIAGQADLFNSNDLEALFKVFDDPSFSRELSRALREFLESEYSIDIYNFIEYIPRYAYQKDRALTTFSCPSHIKEIGEGAFWRCVNLEHIDLPNSLTIIGFGAFESCEKLKNIDLPNSLTTIKWNAFDGCKGLKKIRIPKSITAIDNYAFPRCGDIEYLEIPRKFEPRIDDIFSDSDIAQINYI